MAETSGYWGGVELVGEHLIVDAFGCDPEILNDADLLERKLTDLLHELGMQILHTYFHRFQPQGVTGTIVISTSHLAIHTWPEQRYAAFDLFTCGDMASPEQIENLLRQLSAERCVIYQLTRGNLTGQLPAVQEVEMQAEGSMEIKQSLTQQTSEHQTVPDIQTENWHHEALVLPVLSLARKRDRVLMIGAGNDLPVWEVLKNPDVSRVHVIDIGPLVLNTTSNITEQAALAEWAYADKRVKVFQHGDQFFLSKRRRNYHVIILNLPDPANENIARLYSRDFFEKLSSYLAPDGILVCKSASPHDAPLVFWSIAKTMESAGLSTLSYHVRISSDFVQGFHLAGATRPIKRFIEVPTRLQALPQDQTFRFDFEEHILNQRRNALVNSLQELTLHTLYQQAAKRKD